MVLLTNTNIIVDEFNYGKVRSSYNYIYFLSHMHSDHYQGLSNKWDFGPIYCSIMTKKVLLNKYPLLKNVTGLELNKEYTIHLNEAKTLQIKVVLYDANHIAGSAMFHFYGDMGSFFHTGDFRFDEYMFHEYKTLYPDINDHIVPGIPRAVHIDELILDNTYCDPIFQFPKRSKCVKSIINIIEDNLPCDVYISTYNLGKEEILVELAERFDTKVVVEPERYRDIVCMGFKPEHFTVNVEEGWIFCKKWKDKAVPIEM